MFELWRKPLGAVGLGLILIVGACSEAENQASPATELETTELETTELETTELETTEQAVTVESSTAATQVEAEQKFPDVVAVGFEPDGDGTYRFDVTLSSPYDTADRYADAWRVVGPDGEVFGTRELAHDHASEQPFTRSLAGVAIPEEVSQVVIEARDQANGWGGATIEVEIGAN